MDPNLFVTMGRELRQLKEMHPEDCYLQDRAKVMLMLMLCYEETEDQEDRSEIEIAFMEELKWLVEWKRSKLAIVT